MTADEVMRVSPLIAIVTLTDPGHAELLARALASNGVGVVEITLRTPAALASITQAASRVPEALIGAGTVLNRDELAAAIDAGAAFAVSPGATPALLDAGLSAAIPLIPGVVTPSELMVGLERGYDRFKLFPVSTAGGQKMLNSLLGPFPHAAFCPTGGITLENAPEYLAQPNVICVGGTWVSPNELVAAGDWEAIGALARMASDRLRPDGPE